MIATSPGIVASTPPIASTDNAATVQNAARQPSLRSTSPPTTYPRAEPTGMAAKKKAYARPRRAGPKWSARSPGEIVP